MWSCKKCVLYFILCWVDSESSKCSKYIFYTSYKCDTNNFWDRRSMSVVWVSSTLHRDLISNKSCTREDNLSVIAVKIVKSY